VVSLGSEKIVCHQTSPPAAAPLPLAAVTSRDLTLFGSVAVCLERQSLFAAVVGRHTAGVAFAERTVSGGRLSGRGKGVIKQTGVATRGGLYSDYVQKGA
jgi:hypothetical protein